MNKQTNNIIKKLLIAGLFCLQNIFAIACPTCVGRKYRSREPFFSTNYYQPYSKRVTDNSKKAVPFNDKNKKQSSVLKKIGKAS